MTSKEKDDYQAGVRQGQRQLLAWIMGHWSRAGVAPKFKFLGDYPKQNWAFCRGWNVGIATTCEFSTTGGQS